MAQPEPLRQEIQDHFRTMCRVSRETPSWDLAQRIRRIETLERLQMENQDAIAAAIEADFGGRGEAWSLVADVAAGLNTAREVRLNLAGWMKPERVNAMVPFNLAGSAECTYHPLGVVLCITPWNFP